jgi:transaldolase
VNTFSSSSVSFVDPESRLSYDVREFVKQHIDYETGAVDSSDEPLWNGLRDLGTELWLDSGDIEAIRPLWSQQFSGLTTNNTLLNNEIQKGTYDEFIAHAGQLLHELNPDERVREIALVLNARHGLRLVERFRCAVSVELHTDVAHDCEATLAYARRLHELCPDFFVVKVPLTATGILAAQTLGQEGIPINMTLGFSARQNYVATSLAVPAYVNVFLGRLNAYVANNGLGDGRLVGEKATLASQQEVKVFAQALPQCETKQIAASIRDAEQLERLAGVDVMTIPTQVAADARQRLEGEWTSRLAEEYVVTLAPQVDAAEIHVDKLWSVADETRMFVQQMILQPPSSERELIDAAAEYGATDLFPQLFDAEVTTLINGGKIPQHQVWGDKIMREELAIDSLLTLAGLGHFATSQAELDERIRQHVGA